jgi:preprotein translocase subunit YajC
MTDQSDGPAIVAFKPRKNPDHPALLVDSKPRTHDKNACQHNKGSYIDRDARRVTCQKCGVELDPIDVLHRVAVHGRGLDSRIAEIREHERKQRENAERRAQQQKDAVPMMLATLKVGDKVKLEYDRSSTHGVVSAVDDEAVYLNYQGGYTGTIPVEQITLVRVLKRAARGK